MIIKTKTMYCDGCKNEIPLDTDRSEHLTIRHSHGGSLLFIENDTVHFCHTCVHIALQGYIKKRMRPLVIDCNTCHGTGRREMCAEVAVGNFDKTIHCNECEF